MLGSHVESDLELSKLSIPCILPWGALAFQKQLHNITADISELKHRQLALAAFKKDSELLTKVRSVICDIRNAVTDVEECITPVDSLAAESIGQIFYGRESTANGLNSSSLYLRAVLFWKTIVIPGLALLMPLLGIVLPFFLLKLLGHKMEISDYLMHVRGSILKQISIPSFLKARYDGDRLGGFFEMLFIGVALIMFISSIWSQVNTAFHLRAIYNRLAERGSAVQTCIRKASDILSALEESSVCYGLKDLIRIGKSALADCAIFSNGHDAAASGILWNDPSPIFALRDWLGHIDALTTIASLTDICIVQWQRADLGMELRGLHHPLLKDCVRNDYCSRGHSVLTGPNRGGKSTFCKALGISLVVAQSWGFAWCTKARITPFACIYTALEPAGKLGHASTFEAEIVFAKRVLEITNGPLFVMMDEIFHSTNAVDGIRASRVFMDSLYSKQGCMSLISTHYRELAGAFADRCAAYQMVARGDNAALEYTYKIADGISSKSSVDELLRAHGLLKDAAPDCAEIVAKKDSQPNQSK